MRVHCTRHIVTALPPRVAFLGAAVTDDHFFNAHVPRPPRPGGLRPDRQRDAHAGARHAAPRARAGAAAGIAAIEIYNEKVWDVLAPHTRASCNYAIMIPSPAAHRPRARIASVDAFDHQMRQIAHLRFQGASRLNTQSSRSHLIYRVHDVRSPPLWTWPATRKTAPSATGRRRTSTRVCSHSESASAAAPPARPRALPPQPAHAHARPAAAGDAGHGLCRHAASRRGVHIRHSGHPQVRPGHGRLLPPRPPPPRRRRPRQHAPTARNFRQTGGAGCCAWPPRRAAGGGGERRRRAGQGGAERSGRAQGAAGAVHGEHAARHADALPHASGPPPVGCLRRGQPHEPARWEELIERRRKNLRAMQELTGAQLAAE